MMVLCVSHPYLKKLNNIIGSTIYGSIFGLIDVMTTNYLLKESGNFCSLFSCRIKWNVHL